MLVRRRRVQLRFLGEHRHLAADFRSPGGGGRKPVVSRSNERFVGRRRGALGRQHPSRDDLG
jgi:hypothetical protein